MSSGTLLGGRVRYDQPDAGYRSGLEPVLLAACVPARAGDRVLEAGTGAGAGLLCLAARVGGVSGLGVERDPVMAALAAANFAANGFADLAVATIDVDALSAPGRYDHAFANPPWHQGGTASPNPGREAAKRATPGLLAAWASKLGDCLAHRGTLSVILPGAALAEAVAAFHAADCREIRLLPLWRRAGEAAGLIVLQGVRHGRGESIMLPGLALHDVDGRLTAAAERVLRDGEAIDLRAAHQR